MSLSTLQIFLFRQMNNLASGTMAGGMVQPEKEVVYAQNPEVITLNPAS